MLRNFTKCGIRHVPIFINLKSVPIPIISQAAGKYRQQGKTYVVEDGDIIFFKFNAGAGLTAAKKK